MGVKEDFQQSNKLEGQPFITQIIASCMLAN